MDVNQQIPHTHKPDRSHVGSIPVDHREAFRSICEALSAIPQARRSRHTPLEVSLASLCERSSGRCPLVAGLVLQACGLPCPALGATKGSLATPCPAASAAPIGAEERHGRWLLQGPLLQLLRRGGCGVQRRAAERQSGCSSVFAVRDGYRGDGRTGCGHGHT